MSAVTTQYILRDRSVIDTEKALREYYQHYAFAALMRGLQCSPTFIIDELKTSGLRGRGGAAFPTGLKWQMVFEQAESERYVVANGEEGEPGTFKDRILLEQNPLALLEAIYIATHAVSARAAYVFLNHSYQDIATALEKLLDWIHLDKEAGKPEFASLPAVPIYIRRGRQRYIAGEETALFRVLEGKRAEPSSRPPYPTEQGLWYKPTVINNLETLACIPLIIEMGGSWFASIGPAESHGPKLYCVSGDVNQAGVFEASMAITLRELLTLAGGVRGDFKGAILSGPSGRLLTNADMDLALTIQHGAGNGTLIVFNAMRCAFDLSRQVTDFFYQEHCGQCLPGRQAMREVKQMMDGFEQQSSIESVQQRYQELHQLLETSSKCGLCSAGTGLVPVMMKTYPEDFQHHLQNACSLCKVAV